MKRIYLALTGLGFVLPNFFVVKVSVETGNYLLYTKPLETFRAMFANDTASAFMVDLLFVVFVFLLWTYKKAKEYKIKQLGLVWVLTFALGLAGGFPMFLYLIEKAKEKRLDDG